MTSMLDGSCQCRRVRFRVSEPLASATACHCVQCRKQSAHRFASAEKGDHCAIGDGLPQNGR